MVYSTQQDPIGLAGGLNLYGYADGDPINNSDPFGLSSCPPDCDAGDAADLAAGMIPGVSTAQDAAVLFSGKNHLTGESVGVGGRLIALAGLVTPASGGQFRAASKFVTAGAEALSKRIGRNSVTVATDGGFKRVDLVGKAHDGVPTPHVHEYKVHTNPTTGASRTKKTFVGPATRQDLVDAARETGQIKP